MSGADTSGGPRERGVGVLVLLLVIPLAVGSSLAIWSLAQSPLSASQQVASTVGHVEAAERDDATVTTVELRGAEPFPVVTQSSGVVTDLAITPGEDIAQGTAVLRVDDREVVALVADSPMYRDVGPGDEGEDVTAVQTLLIDLDLLSGSPTGRVDGPTESAIRAFNQEYGGTSEAVMLRTSLLWVPADASQPVTVTLRVGTEVTSGTEVYTARAARPVLDVATDASDSDRVLTVGDHQATLPAGEVTVDDDEFVSAVTEMVDDSTTLPASIALAEPRSVGVVPASAVVTDADGSVCFFPGPDGDAVPITQVEGAYGLVDVDADLVGSPVLLNPRDTRQDLTCR